MSDPTVFRACYADWQLIRSRSVVKISVEIPIEQEGYAYQVLGGMPDPSKSVWLGIARLETAPVKIQNKPRSFGQEAGKMCESIEFQTFLRSQFDVMVQFADFVRKHCGVGSRSEIIEGTTAAEKWSDLMAKFELWRHGR